MATGMSLRPMSWARTSDPSCLGMTNLRSSRFGSASNLARGSQIPRQARNEGIWIRRTMPRFLDQLGTRGSGAREADPSQAQDRLVSFAMVMRFSRRLNLPYE